MGAVRHSISETLERSHRPAAASDEVRLRVTQSAVVPSELERNLARLEEAFERLELESFALASRTQEPTDPVYEARVEQLSRNFPSVLRVVGDSSGSSGDNDTSEVVEEFSNES